MAVFLFRILPVLDVAVLAAAVVFIGAGYAKGSRKLRIAGMGLAAAFVLLTVCTVLSVLARL